eukprot:3531902-Alexandrium_andersonii.AAC.1
MDKAVAAPAREEKDEDSAPTTTLDWEDTFVKGHSKIDDLRARLFLELWRVHREVEELRKADVIVRK